MADKSKAKRQSTKKVKTEGITAVANTNSATREPAEGITEAYPVNEGITESQSETQWVTLAGRRFPMVDEPANVIFDQNQCHGYQQAGTGTVYAVRRVSTGMFLDRMPPRPWNEKEYVFYIVPGIATPEELRMDTPKKHFIQVTGATVKFVSRDVPHGGGTRSENIEGGITEVG